MRLVHILKFKGKNNENGAHFEISRPKAIGMVHILKFEGQQQ
jgi:hypothetical protein